MEVSLGTGAFTYLCVVHFKLSDNLDGNFTKLAGIVLCPIDIAECTVTHLIHQRVTFETGIFGHLGSALSFLCYDTLNDVGLIGMVFLVVGGGTSGNISCSGGHIAVVDSCSREIALVLSSCLERLVFVYVRVTHTVVLLEPLWLGMDVLHISCRLAVWWRVCNPRLLSMAKEIFEILHGSHFSQSEPERRNAEV